MNTLELTKSLGLTPKTKRKVPMLYYNGIYSQYKYVPCRFVDLVCENPQIVKIEVNSLSHDIALDYLLEMQISDHRVDKGKCVTVLPLSYCVVDLETSGFSPKYDQIIEIGIVKVRNGEAVESFSSLINTSSLSKRITKITGITQAMLDNAPSLYDVIPQAIEFIGNDIIVGHNITFDINFLYDAKLQIMGSTLQNDFFCTMRLFKHLHKELAHHRLCDMVDFYNIQNKNAHRALDDSYATFYCYNKMTTETYKSYGSYQIPLDKRGMNDE